MIVANADTFGIAALFAGVELPLGGKVLRLGIWCGFGMEHHRESTAFADLSILR